MKGAGWLVVLETRASSVPLFLTVSSDARFGWIPDMDDALVLAREADADALARYAAARVGKEAAVRTWQHPEAQDVLHDDASREIARLRRRVEDLELLLATIRRLREKDFERAAQLEAERKDGAGRHRES
jgi:hypothetical protein